MKEKDECEIIEENKPKLTNSDIFEILTVAPEEGESMKMNISFYCQSFQFSEESLTKM